MLERTGCWLVSSGTGSVLNPLHTFRLNAISPLVAGQHEGRGEESCHTSNTLTVQHSHH